MKTVFKLFLIIILFSSASCSKEEKLETKLAGSWELRSSLHGSMTVTNYPPGNGYIRKFEENKFQLFYKEKLNDSGTFKIVKKKAIIDGEELTYKMVILTLNGLKQTFSEPYFKISGNTLTLYLGSFETQGNGLILVYEKQ